jgi:hypothetical protein
MVRKDGRSQRWTLANNLAANAEDMVVTRHGAHNGRGDPRRQGPYWAAELSLSQDAPPLTGSRYLTDA